MENSIKHRLITYACFKSVLKIIIGINIIEKGEKRKENMEGDRFSLFSQFRDKDECAFYL